MTLVQLAEQQEVSLDSYLILPGRARGNYEYPDLLVAQDVSYKGKNWHESHEVLHREDSFMLNPRQFIDFLNLLKKRKVYDGRGSKANSSRVRAVLGGIMGKRDPWRAEWLDAYFAYVDRNMYMFYNHRTIDGRLLATRVEPLEKYIREDCYVDLGSANRQGLPVKKSRSQETYFMGPRKNSVAWLRADFGRVVLCCNWDSLPSGSALGSRRAKIFHRK